MAKLIIMRPVKPSVFRGPASHILVDGWTAGYLAAGMKVEVPLQAGRHEVSARMGFMRSSIFSVECEPETMLCLRVAFRPFLDLPRSLAFVLYASGPVIVFVIGGIHRALVADTTEHVWFMEFLLPFAILSYAVAAAVMAATRLGSLRLETMPAVDSASRQVALPVTPHWRIKITVRGLMIAVAMLAVLLGFGVHRWRTTRGDLFRRLALRHARWETGHREFVDHLKARLDAETVNSLAGMFAARADYHAAMRRKYEEAAARGAMSVEPDPPEPP